MKVNIIFISNLDCFLLQCLNTYKGFIFLILNLLAFVSIFNAVYFRCSIWCSYFTHIYLTSFFIINLQVANFVIFEILSIFSSTAFIGVNNIFCFFYKWPNFPVHYTFSVLPRIFYLRSGWLRWRICMR